MIFQYLLITALVSIFFLIFYIFMNSAKEEICGTTDFEEDETEDFSLMRGGRRTYKVWFEGGGVRDLDQEQFQQKVMEGFAEISSFTNTDFVKVPTKGGSFIRIYVVSDATMRKRWKDPTGQNRVPLALRVGNQIWYRRDYLYWASSPTLPKSVTIHEGGHVFGLKHTTDQTSIMHPSLTAASPNANDKQNFQKRLGKV